MWYGRPTEPTRSCCRFVADLLPNRNRLATHFLVQCRALHEHTACLPEVTATIPELPYGRDTTDAIRAGVCRGLTGAVRGLVEGYATSLNRWPHVVATGGGIELLAPLCDFVDSLVPDLTLRGVGLAYQKHLSEMGV